MAEFPRLTGVEPDAGMSKTLHHGLVILEELARRPEGLTVTEVADAVGVHRTVAHRLLRTLEAHQLVRRDEHKRVRLSTGLVSLAESVEHGLRAVALPVLERLAETTQATAHLVVRESDSQARVLLVVEPRRAPMHIAFKPGQPIEMPRGSAAMAILATEPVLDGERPEVAQARRDGYAVSAGEVVPSTVGVSVGIPGGRTTPSAAIGLSLFDEESARRTAPDVVEAARELAALLP
jgi:DNA-binding IclR family transcriptional regulator